MHKCQQNKETVEYFSMCFTEGAVTTRAPAGQAAADRAALRPNVVTAATLDLGAALTPILPTNGQAPLPNPGKLPTTAGTHMVCFMLACVRISLIDSRL